MERLLTLITVVALSLTWVVGSEARAQAPVQSAGIDTLSTCGEADGGFDFELVPPTFATGQEIGSAESVLVARSFSMVEIPIEELTAAEASIVLIDGNDALLGCGTIGGRLESNGRVVFGITEVNDSGISGVAVLAPVTETNVTPQTGVSLFVTGVEPTLVGQGTPASSRVEGTPQASPVR